MIAQPPVIIIGMHCSGTSLITHMLEKLGLFVGWKKDCHNEALFFQNLNRWLIRQCGGSWDHPEPINTLLSNRKIRPLVVEYLNNILNSPRVISYLGMNHYLNYRRPVNLDIAWGWKDPCNTVTLPLWLDIFPDAKIIHVCRHGIDVAKALKNRHEKSLAKCKSRYSKAKSIYWLRPKKSGFAESVRCGSRAGGLSLWETYIGEARRRVARLGGQAIELKFEDLLSNPEEHLERLAHFAGLPARRELINETIQIIRKDMMYSYRSNRDLTAFAIKNTACLKQYGYSP